MPMNCRRQSAALRRRRLLGPAPPGATRPPIRRRAPCSRKPNDNWSQWLRLAQRNNTPVGVNIPTEWEVGEFDYKTGDWDPAGAKNIKWVAELGSRSYGSAVVHNGKVFVGTNNTAAYLKRYPAEVDLGCLMCFDVKDGKFLWQHSSPKLPSGRVHDWPHEGICSRALLRGRPPVVRHQPLRSPVPRRRRLPRRRERRPATSTKRPRPTRKPTSSGSST